MGIDSSSLWHAPRLSQWSAQALGLACAVMLVVLARDLLIPIEQSPSLPFSARQTAAHNAPPVSIDSITALDLFGRKPADSVPDIASLPTTNLNLKIAGIIASTNPGTSRVLISADSKPAQSFFVGDTVSPNVSLHSIEHDFVVVQRGDQLEKLPLHASASIANALNNSRGTPTLVPATQLTTAPAITAAPTSQTVYRDLEDRLAQIRQKKPS